MEVRHHGLQTLFVFRQLQSNGDKHIRSFQIVNTGIASVVDDTQCPGNGTEPDGPIDVNKMSIVTSERGLLCLKILHILSRLHI